MRHLAPLTVSVCLVGCASLYATNNDNQGGNNQQEASTSKPAVVQPTPEGQVNPQANQDGEQDQTLQTGSIADWAQVILTIAAGYLAWRAFRDQRETTRLTQRADVLVVSASVTPKDAPLDRETVVSVEFKNFGPTRASNVQLRAWLEYADVRGPEEHPIVPVTMGGGDTQTVAFGPIEMFMKGDTARAINEGRETLKFTVIGTYDDAFGLSHRTRSEGVYRHDVRVFEITAHESD